MEVLVVPMMGPQFDLIWRVHGNTSGYHDTGTRERELGLYDARLMVAYINFNLLRFVSYTCRLGGHE